MSARNTKQSAITAMRRSNPRVSRNIRQPCFTMKRPLLFQVRKSLVEYVDDELLAMNTSVFYQRIFILAKNVEPPRMSQVQLVTLPQKKPIVQKDADEQGTAAGPDSTEVTVKSDGTFHSDKPATDGTRSDPFSNMDYEDGEEEEEEEVEEVKPPSIAGPKDMFVLFSEKLQHLAKHCSKLAYTPDPMCGLLVYMNDYTMLMLESGEDMMGIFCGELLKCVAEFWQSNRVVMIEDHIKQLYTKEMVFRRIPAAFLNEKFPPSTPTDEYLMGKQHLIIKDKMQTICRLISESLEPMPNSTSVVTERSYSDTDGESEGNQWGFEEEDKTEPISKRPSAVSVESAILSPDIYRKLLPEIQRIELVLASTRFYYTLQEFFQLYGTVPYARDDDSFWWPIQNNYAPPNIFRRSPFDINLTFAEYAAEMARLMQEEADRHKAEQEAAEQAEAAAAEAAAEAAGSKPAKPPKDEGNEE